MPMRVHGSVIITILHIDKTIATIMVIVAIAMTDSASQRSEMSPPHAKGS